MLVQRSAATAVKFPLAVATAEERADHGAFPELDKNEARVLWAIRELNNSASGAEISLMLEKSVSNISAFSGNLYPALHRLESNGCLNSAWEDFSIAEKRAVSSKNPNEKPPRRRYYSMTLLGKGALIDCELKHPDFFRLKPSAHKAEPNQPK